MKPIIILYSNGGTTRKVAERINETLECEVAEIKPKVPYGPYLKALKRAVPEIDNGIVAEYDAPDIDLSDIDTVLIGYPIWHNDAPPFVLDYLKKQDFTGKTIIPFSTAGGSNIKGSLKKLQDAVGSAKIKLPYSSSMFKKDNFDKWKEEVSKLLMLTE